MNFVIRIVSAVLLVLTAMSSFATAGSAQDELRIVFVTHGQAADPFWSVVQKGTEQAGKDMGVKVEYQAPSTYDMVQMSQLIDAAVASKPDGIVVSIPDGDALTPAIQKAKDAGIPVISINSGYETSRKLGLFTHVGQTEYDAGVGGGKKLGESGVTKALCVIHEAGNAGLEDRCRGVADGLKGSGGSIEQVVVDLNNPTEAQQRISAAMTSDPDINGIMTLGPAGATAAIASVMADGTAGKVKIATFDLTPEVLTGISDGNVLFAIDQQQYLQGYLPVVFLTQYSRNGNTLGSDIVMTGPGYVDKSNVDKVKNLTEGGTR